MTYDYRVEVTRLAEDVASGDWCEEIEITTDRRRDWDKIADRVLRFARRNDWVTEGEPEVHVVRVYENGTLIENHASEVVDYSEDEYASYQESEELYEILDTLNFEVDRELAYDW